MRNVTKNKLKNWAGLAVKLGVLLSEPKIRAAITDQVKDRVDSARDTVADKYEDALDRLEAVGASLRGRRDYWPSRVTGFVIGVGVGAGLGILLAPVAGSETREAIRRKAVDAKKSVVESVSATTGKVRQSVASMPSTGTVG